VPESTNSVLIRHLAPKNFLSFGPTNTGIDLLALNVFIGPNGSGKSNLIEAISLMRSAPKEYREVTRKGGGVAEWIWKGQPKAPALVEWVVSYPKGQKPLRHTMAFHPVSQAFSLDNESVEESEPRHSNAPDVYFYYRYRSGNPVINTVSQQERTLAKETIEPDRSILAQRRDPDTYPELAWLAQSYENGLSDETPCFGNPRKRI